MQKRKVLCICKMKIFEQKFKHFKNIILTEHIRRFKERFINDVIMKVFGEDLIRR